jgi:hypothetical protein
MSPPTQQIALFSVNPHVVANWFNARVGNTTGSPLYDNDRLNIDLQVLPNVYSFGMSGQSLSANLLFLLPLLFIVIKLNGTSY